MPDSLQTHVQGREGKVSVPGQADIWRDREEGGGSGGGAEGEGGEVEGGGGKGGVVRVKTTGEGVENSCRS